MPQSINLILHEGNQWRDDQRDAALHLRRQLIAE